ncbi:MAG: hypothetical protein JXA07_12750 [Spirochaetes bacterium]|nr:hypothetical protein [Spirochaetota bacterium]
MFESWRFNPFSEVMNSVLVEEEEHTIEYHADWNGYGIQLNEGPQLDNPSTVVIVEDVTGGATFTEVPRTQAPAAGQYRVDYAAATYYGTGRIQFNAADVGKKIRVTYYGTGWTVKSNYRQSQLTVPTNMEVEEDATIHGDLTLDGENTGKGNLSVAGDAAIGGALAATGGITGDVTGDVTGNADTADGLNETGSGAGVVHKKIIAIGDWNMSTTASVNIAHGLTRSKIRDVVVEIRNDADTETRDLTTHEASTPGYYVIGETNIVLTRGNLFTNSFYESTSYNRGWIIIEYID